MKCVSRVIRLLLCILILFCSAVIGLHLSRRLTLRRELLMNFDKLLHRAMIGISYQAGDLCEVFSDNFDGFVFTHTMPFAVQWERFVRRFTAILRKEDIRMLTEFAQGLGASDTDAQRQHISLYIELLKEHIDASQEDIRLRSKMLRVVPLSIGIVIALMMI